MKRAWLFACGIADWTSRLPGLSGAALNLPLRRDPGAATLRGFRLNGPASANGNGSSNETGSVLVRDRSAAVRGTLIEVPAEAVDAFGGDADGAIPSLLARRSVRDATGRRRKAWVFVSTVADGPFGY